MNRHLYYNRAGQPVDEILPEMWTDEARRVAFTQVNGYDVSTVHLVVNHQFGDGPPIIFETMVFRLGETLDQYCDRYSTEAQAQKGHEEIVTVIRSLEGVEGVQP